MAVENRFGETALSDVDGGGFLSPHDAEAAPGDGKRIAFLYISCGHKDVPAP